MNDLEENNQKNILSELYLTNKPAGFATHKVSEQRPLGFVEYLSNQLAEPLKVVHRLDRETTGAMVFAKTKEAAKILGQLFEKREVHKEYLFLTDRDTGTSETLSAQSFIEKTGGQFTSDSKAQKPNSETTFSLIKKQGKFTLWRAQPKTGKPHQIRLHAKDLGIPILGDTAHGGSSFPNLMLHSHRLQFEIKSYKVVHEATPPRLMENLELLGDPLLVQWLIESDRRQRSHPEVWNLQNESLRIVHDKVSGYNIDRMGECLWFYRFKEDPVTDKEKQSISTFCTLLGSKQHVLREMKNRGQNPDLEKNEGKGNSSTWQIQENGLRYELRKDQGWSPGLFLDQRENRKAVYQQSKGLKVLNLFCYTAGFSVCAAKGGAEQVTSVDTSRRTLEWAKKNFEINELHTSGHLFYAQDAREFLKIAEKKSLSYDLIICDPPSFARNKKSVFRIDKDFSQLMTKLYKLLSQNGKLLFSSNYEKWSLDNFLQETRKVLPKSASCTEGLSSYDHELPDQEKILKSFWVHKK